jgi:hypothetical protein
MFYIIIILSIKTICAISKIIKIYVENRCALKKMEKIKNLFPEAEIRDVESFIKNTKESHTLFLLNKKIPLQ